MKDELLEAIEALATLAEFSTINNSSFPDVKECEETLRSGIAALRKRIAELEAVAQLSDALHQVNESR